MRQMVDGDLTEHGAGGEQTGTGRPPGGKPESDRNAGDRSSRGRSQNDRQKRRAMTRMIDRVSDDFVSTFSETGVDHGPEGEQKKQPPSLAAQNRDERERAEAEAQKQAKAELRGFGALLGAKRATSQNLNVGGMFSRLLGGEDGDAAGSVGGASGSGTISGGATAFEAPDGPTADGSVIKVKGTVGKKRGLYTSCMKKPVLPEDVIAATNTGAERGVADRAGSAIGGVGGADNAGLEGGGAGTLSGGVSLSDASHQQTAHAPASMPSTGSQHGPSHVVPQVPVRGNFSHSEHVHEKSFPLYDAATTSKGVSFNNRAGRSEVQESSDGPDESFPAPNITSVPVPHVRSAAASAREFEMPTVPEQAKQEGKDFSTLRKLANDGKGSKVIPNRPAPAGSRNSKVAPDTESLDSSEPSHGSSGSPKTGIVGKFFGALKKLFGGG